MARDFCRRRNTENPRQASAVICDFNGQTKMTTEFNTQLDNYGVKYCFNEQVYDFAKLKFIIVGDNPGNTEYKEKRFFIGPSGQELRRHFKSNGLTTDFDNECIIFNKTFIHTTKTIELEPIAEQIGKVLFDDIQTYCAKEIAEISNKFNLPILVFGKSNIGPKLLFDSFWKAINQFNDNKENLLVFNHPSPPYLQFDKEWDKYESQFKTDLPIALLKRIGTINSENINNKYIKQMEARFFYGASTHNTWPKLFVLTSDGKFYCEYLDFMKAARVNLNFDFSDFKATDYKWDGYQSIVEIDEATAKSKTLTKQANWISTYLNSKR